MGKKQEYPLKPLFLERMNAILGKEMDSYLDILKKELQNSIRCNTLKITPNELKKRLETKGWVVEQPFKDFPEVMIIEGKFANHEDKAVNDSNNLNKDKVDLHIKTHSLGGVGGKDLIDLGPGELGRSMEHLLGYYYVQEIASMLPVFALKPKPGDFVLDVAAAPGSKTTQLAAVMENQGTIIANDSDLGRLKILASNMERCGATNAILTKKDGIALCKRLLDEGFEFDKILLDAPCSGEGTLRNSSATARMWNPKTIKSLSRLQKGLLISALDILKIGGEMIYSTCTHAPEENEEVLDFAIKEFGKSIKIEKINLPIKCRPGISSWLEDKYDKQVESSCRIYPQDNDTEGFFLAKIKKLK